MHKKAKPEGIFNLIILHIIEALMYFIAPHGRTCTEELRYLQPNWLLEMQINNVLKPDSTFIFNNLGFFPSLCPFFLISLRDYPLVFF